SLVFTPMMIEDGRRLVISNLDLRSAISNDGMVLARKRSGQILENHSVEAIELFRLFAVSENFTVATASRMSASFPYFSPAVSLPTNPRRRVVDAGYYDNYGVSLAGSWLSTPANREWFKDKKWDSILFIQIRDGISEETRQLRKIGPDSSDTLSRTF